MAVEIYSKAQCPYCDRAMALLDSKNVTYRVIRIDLEAGKREEMVARSQRRTVPQIFIHGHHVGGFDDLFACSQDGSLNELLANNQP